MAKTKIPWANYSWNPIRYLDGWMCTKVSPGCLHCYAESGNLRFGNGIRYQPLLDWQGFRLDETVLQQPLHWHNPRRIFVQSMGDLFHEKIPVEYLQKIFGVIEQCPQHVFQILTKRPEKMSVIYKPVLGGAEHVWLGVSVETEKYLHRVNALNEIAAAVKFVSLEPLLEDMTINNHLKYLNWVIVGPETGSGRRPCEIEWIENVVAQCDAAQVPVFVKALPIEKRISHDPAEWPEHLRRREYPK